MYLKLRKYCIFGANIFDVRGDTGRLRTLPANIASAKKIRVKSNVRLIVIVSDTRTIMRFRGLRLHYEYCFPRSCLWYEGTKNREGSQKRLGGTIKSFEVKNFARREFPRWIYVLASKLN